MTLPNLGSDLDLDLIDFSLSWLNQQQCGSQNHRRKAIILEKREERKKLKHFTCDQSDNCDICEFNRDIATKNHSKSQVTIHQPSCVFCKKSFESYEELDVHKRTHWNEWTCEYMGSQDTIRWSLKCHQ